MAGEDRRQPSFLGHEHRSGDEGGDETVDRTDADEVVVAVTAQDFVEFWIGEWRIRHAASASAACWLAAFQFQASS